MKKFSFLFSIAACIVGLGILSGCSNDSGFGVDGGSDDGIVVDVSMQNVGATRATADGLSLGFSDGDAIGVYVLDASGKVLSANAKFTLSGGKWTGNAKYSPYYKYFAYYPYVSGVSGGPAVGSTFSSATADNVFSSLVSSWTPAADQSTLEKFTGADLCISEGKGDDSRKVSFSMAHQMGIIEGSGAFPAFSGNIPFVNKGKYYYIVKPGVDTSLGGAVFNVNKGEYQETYINPSDYPVDLGLPSGLKWAAGNVGAKNPEDYGLYFAWGETTGYTAAQVAAGVRAFTQDEYNAGPAASISTNLTLEQDAARANLGGEWRMPTKAEYQELIDNCNVTWTADYNGTGVKGRVFTSKVNGNSVFFPAAGICIDSSVYDVGWRGYCWSASWYSPSDAWYLSFNSGDQSVYDDSRYCGFSVRGVCE